MFKPSLKPGQSGGFSILELMITMAVLVVIVQAFGVFMKNVSVQNLLYREKNLAMEKAIQMLEELRSLVNEENVSVSVLNQYDDTRDSGIPVYKFTLSTRRNITHDPSNPGVALNDAQQALLPVSGNPLIPGRGYKYCRHVEISNDPNDASIKHIRVRVFKATNNLGADETNPAMAAEKKPLAEVFSIVRSMGQDSIPTQVIDIYLVNIESVPGWWSRNTRLQTLMQSTLYSLQARNRGLRFREHWVRRMSFGRDLEYTPEINHPVRADDNFAFQKTYIYPGLIQYDDGDDKYYDSNWFQARINEGGTIANNLGYALADQFNHAMRLPDEENLYEILKTIATNRGEEAPELSLRLLLEKMNRQDPDMLNSIVINLHGEMIPVVPLRNYSDPAKDPEYYEQKRMGLGHPPYGLRAVTHPEKIHFNSTSENPAVRVYGFNTNPSLIPAQVSENDTIDVVTLFIPGASVENLNQVERLQGNSFTPYYWHRFNDSSWNRTGDIIHDNWNPANSNWTADNYTTPDGRVGLRILLFGVTPTARPYAGNAYTGP
jgi:type II secretory pathway pseudopilin PulG